VVVAITKPFVKPDASAKIIADDQILLSVAINISECALRVIVNVWDTKELTNRAEPIFILGNSEPCLTAALVAILRCVAVAEPPVVVEYFFSAASIFTATTAHVANVIVECTLVALKIPCPVPLHQQTGAPSPLRSIHRVTAF